MTTWDDKEQKVSSGGVGKNSADLAVYRVECRKKSQSLGRRPLCCVVLNPDGCRGQELVMSDLAFDDPRHPPSPPLADFDMPRSELAALRSLLCHQGTS